MVSQSHNEYKNIRGIQGYKWGTVFDIFVEHEDEYIAFISLPYPWTQCPLADA